MILVNRPTPGPADVLAALSKPLRNGRTELHDARAYYSAVPPPEKAYAFRRYKEFEVCQALDSLFHGKCAYCESPYRAVDALDIEHFRPKGGVSESKNHPGYWWLAAVWTNLLPSCPACNQRRKHAQYAPGMTLEELEYELLRAPAIVTGKGNAFPVKGGNWVAIEGGDLALEEPLLINPCERNPEQHLEWVFDCDPKLPIWSADPVFAFVRPRTTADGGQDEYAKASIAIYGLNRSGVIRERAERVKELQRASEPVVDALLDLATLTDDRSGAANRLRKRLARYKADLLSFTHPAKRYSAMASAYVYEFDIGLGALSEATPAT
jgi:hypothetical protein